MHGSAIKHQLKPAGQVKMFSLLKGLSFLFSNVHTLYIILYIAILMTQIAAVSLWMYILGVLCVVCVSDRMQPAREQYC